MAFQITISFASDALNVESKDAFATQFGWTASNPLNKTQFRDDQIKKWIKDVIRNERTRAAYQTAAEGIAAVPD